MKTGAGGNSPEEEGPEIAIVAELGSLKSEMGKGSAFSRSSATGR